jgi:hypothetical protein
MANQHRKRILQIGIVVAVFCHLGGAVAQDRAPQANIIPRTEIQAIQSDMLVEQIGVCVHLSYFNTPYGDFDDIVRPRLLEAGIRYIRDGAVNPGKAGANHLYYQRMRILSGDGIRFSYSVPENFDLGRLNDVYEWSGRGIEFFESGNEPNLSSNPNWADVSRPRQQALYETIRSNPNLSSVAVLGPALAGIGPKPRQLGDVSAFVDYGNWHTYSGGRYPEYPKGGGSLHDFIQEAENVFPGKKLVLTEAGYHSALKTKRGHPPTSDPIIARYMPRLFLWDLKEGIRRTYVYELLSTHVPNDEDQEANFGLLSHDGVSKPSFYAIKNLIHLFADPGPHFAPGPLGLGIEGDIRNLQVMLFQKRSGTYELVIWLGVPAWDNVTRSELPVAPQNVRIQLPSGVSRPKAHRFGDDGSVSIEDMRPNKGAIDLSVSDHLTVLMF